MAILETTLRDVIPMLVDQHNATAGVLGCQLEAVVVDPASDWPLFAEPTRQHRPPPRHRSAARCCSKVLLPVRVSI